MSIPVISFATMPLHYNSKLTLEAFGSNLQAGGEALLQGLLMGWQGMPADELPHLYPAVLQA